YLASRDVRILRLDNRPDGQWYELYHDVFAEIIKGWTDRFREDEDRHIYGQIVTATRKWEQEQHDDNALLRGERLVQAEEWNKKNRENLASQEKVFVDTSSKRRRKTLFVRRTVAGVIVLLAVAAVIFGVSAEQEKDVAERLRFVSITQSLSAQALYEREWKQDERAALLARQAYLFNQRQRGNMLNRIDDTLRIVLNTPYFCRILHSEREVVALALSPDGKTLVSGNSDGSIALWSLSKPSSAPVILRGHLGIVWSVAFSPDSQTLVSGGWDRTVRLWNLKNPAKAPTILRDHKGIVFSVAFSPDGVTLATGSADTTIRLWNFQDPGNKPRVLRGHDRSVNAVVFSPDGRTLASGGSDNTVYLWNLQDPTVPSMMLRENAGEITALAFSPDGHILASDVDDYTLRLWNLTSPNRWPSILHGHDGTITSIAFSRDGQTLASASWDKTVR
ncbi:MAG: WD40 repeat domain-containing protein, partial [Gammaproteobacteria bacterium]|nr:WD40 repeat domain-containing protein [Gammaproteobacteria bacterium]